MQTICLNCGNEFEGRYCNQCGQKKISGRLSIKESFEKFLHSFTHIDKGIFYLAFELFKRPGYVASDYISGKRATYFNPFQYLIILVAISTFITVKFNLLGPVINTALVENPTPQQKFSAGMSEFFYKYFNLVLFFSVPVIAFFSWLFFRRSGYNYAENLVFITLLSAQRTLFYILLTPFLYFFIDYWFISIGVYYAFWLIFFIWAYLQFYKQGIVITSIKYIIVMALTIAIMQSIAVAIVMATM